MKVSFLVTFYNQYEYVSACIESILAIKKDFEWEILIGDDGSTDKTREIVQKYIDKFPKNIRLYCMERNNGVKQIVKRSSLNRINLVNHMSGDFFCIIDGDDYYCDNDFVRKAMMIFADNPKLSVVAFGYQRVTNACDVISKYAIDKSGLVSLDTYLKNYYTPAGACVFRNILSNNVLDKLNQIGFYDDNDIVMLSLNYGELYAVPEIVYSYRQNDESTYNSMDDIEQMVLNVQGWDADRNYLTRARRCLLYRNIRPIVQMVFQRRNIKKLGSKKIGEYYKESESIPDSYTKLLLGYERDSWRHSVRLICFILKVAIYFPKCFVKEVIKYFMKELAALMR